MSAAGTTSSIDAVILGASLTEIEKRRDSRLVSAAFKALLASYRDEELRPILRRYCSRNFNMLRSNLRTFADRSGILIGNGELETLAQQLVQCNTIRSFLFEHELSSNILMSNYGLEFKLATIRNAVALESPNLLPVLDWSFETERGTPLADFYEAMLVSFESRSPPPHIQKALLSKAIEQYGDPRIREWPGLTGSESYQRRDRCLSIIKRWLSIE
jgi:hypothetical protein